MHVCIIETGHHKLAFEIDSLDAFLAASAIEEDVVHFPDATNLSVADGHGLGPRMRAVIGVNSPVSVIGGAGSFLRQARFRVECGNDREDNERDNAGKESNAIRSDFHRDFSSATPETPRTVSSARFKPASLPAESYHSCNECAPPPLPPAPMEMASIPCDSGIFASVEERSMRDSLPTISSAARSAASSGESKGNSPPGRLPSNSTFHSSFPLERSRAESISSRTPAMMHSRSADSRRVSSSSLSERMSTFKRAS